MSRWIIYVGFRGNIFPMFLKLFKNGTETLLRQNGPRSALIDVTGAYTMEIVICSL